MGANGSNKSKKEAEQDQTYSHMANQAKRVQLRPNRAKWGPTGQMGPNGAETWAKLVSKGHY